LDMGRKKPKDAILWVELGPLAKLDCEHFKEM